MTSKFIFISLALSCCLLSLIQAQTTTQPDQVIGFIRHGARGPLSNYDSTWSTSDWGMLTATGMRQEFLLGQLIAQKYPKVFGATYDPFYIYALSDYTYRCIESLVAVCDGIYYGTGPQLRSNQNPSVAIPPFVDSSVQDILNSLTDLSAVPGQRAPVIVDTVTSSTDTIFARFLDDSYCNNADNWIDQNNADSATTAAWTTFKPTIDKVNSYLSSKLTTPYSVTIYGDFMLVDVHDQRVLPGGLTDQDVINEFVFAYSYFVYHQEYAQLTQRQVSAYYPVKELLKQLNYYVTSSYYLYNGILYGAHDYNIYAILAAFNIVNDTCIIANYKSYIATGTLAYPACVYPDFAANIFFELYYTSTTTPFVKFYFHNIWIPLCNGKDCSYTDFVTFANNAIGNMSSSTFKTACGN